MRTSTFITTDEQADHNEPGMPFVYFEHYQTPDCTGCRRLAYGATEEEARARGEANAIFWPIPAGVPNEVAAGRVERPAAEA